ncbi:MAG: SAM-dependent chlorinase/fluorinase [Deltaproteobacteria bacterium]|nr:SAM-dependent chlorinase/fluorinase [Deltaproteobacteria bacterium]
MLMTLTTDFGLKDPYQGAMKGAILSVNREARIIDITHLISPGNILEGALVMLESCGFFPKGTIHVGVVDPGVGGKRRPILVETERFLFVGPDNGLFSLVLRNEKVKRVVHLTEERYFRKEVSNTFHGRDIFGPVAAHLSKGVSPSGFGPEITDILGISLPEPEREKGVIAGEVIYVDSFGNIITNINGSDALSFGPDASLELNGKEIKGLKRTYSEAGNGSPLSLISSSDFLEIAVNAGDAGKAFNARVGDKVFLRAKG